jgi:DNA-directed RNA polymerase specialized sigma24 family protein
MPASALGPRDDSDVALQQLMRSNEEEGVARLIALHGGRVKAMLRRQFGQVLDDALLEDAFLQAMARAWRSRYRFDPTRGTAHAWFGAIAYRCALVILTRERRLRVMFGDVDRRPAPPAVTATMLERDGQRQLLIDLHACIDRLPGLQRFVLLADLAAGGDAVAAQQIAAETGALVPSIYVARSRAISRLRNELAALGHEFAAIERVTRRPARGNPPLSFAARPREEGT